MTADRYDAVVVGGGINGVGVAQALAVGGHSVLVLERTAIAAGTSSKSSKLIHGGLRYLESFQFGLVRESLHERALLLKNAPELVRLQRFLIPVYAGMRRPPWLIRTGLSLYYVLSSLDRNARFAVLPASAWPNLAGLETRGLRAVMCYNDAVTDDAALTRAVMRSAQHFGAELQCPAEFSSAVLHEDGVEVRYSLGVQEHTCRAGVLINASGPWVNNVAAAVRPVQPMVTIELVQGAHIEIPFSLGEYFYYLESPRDGRAVFVMPRERRTVVGTTETRFRADPDSVRALSAEENYLLGVVGHYFPGLAGLQVSDLLASWAGLRVLPAGSKHAFHRSRETVLQVDTPLKPRFLSIYGGKLTTYRATAAHVVRRLAATLPERKAIADTAALRLEPD